MERLDDENDETRRNQILTERRSSQFNVYNDVVRVLEEDDGEKNRRN